MNKLSETGMQPKPMKIEHLKNIIYISSVYGRVELRTTFYKNKQTVVFCVYICLVNPYEKSTTYA